MLLFFREFYRKSDHITCLSKRNLKRLSVLRYFQNFSSQPQLFALYKGVRQTCIWNWGGSTHKFHLGKTKSNATRQLINHLAFAGSPKYLCPSNFSITTITSSPDSQVTHLLSYFLPKLYPFSFRLYDLRFNCYSLYNFLFAGRYFFPSGLLYLYWFHLPCRWKGGLQYPSSFQIESRQRSKFKKLFFTV